MQEAQTIRNLYKDAKGITQLQKPDKFFLENMNFQYAFSPANANIGNLRETFFANQLSHSHLIEYTEYGDFAIDDKYIFEIGANNKTTNQIKNS